MQYADWRVFRVTMSEKEALQRKANSLWKHLWKATQPIGFGCLLGYDKISARHHIKALGQTAYYPRGLS